MADAAASICAKAIHDAALTAAPHMRAHCINHNGGISTSDEDIVIGLISRALASAIVKYCNSYEQCCDVTRVIQTDVAIRVGDMLLDGRPVGNLHS